MADAPVKDESGPLTIGEWLEDAALFRRYADQARRLIALEECPGGASDRPSCPQAKAALLNLAAIWDKMAEEAEARSRILAEAGLSEPAAQ
jgi:hypothetical protein